MQPRTILFIGPQGSGKGTQIELLVKRLAEAGESPLLIETGQLFRDLSATNTYAAHYIAEALKTGELLPDAITSGLVVDQLVHKLTADNRLLFDGYPRNQRQARTLFDLLEFLGREHVDVIQIVISDEVAIERMQGRGRNDDTTELIRKRLAAYHEYTKPLREFCIEKPSVLVHEFNGETTIENLHEQICKVIL